jgi:cation transport protein ChaC
MAVMSDFWVFGYGSLIWNPGFEVIKKERAQLFGLHRSFCVYSWVHRGTQENPGLVLGLDKGGSCQGMAMLAPGINRDEIIDYLRARELVTNVYLECWRKVRLQSGEHVSALVYRADQNHPQYASGLCLDTQTDIVRKSQGKSGHNVDYVKSTVSAMKENGIRDYSLEYIDAKLRD